MGYFNYKACPLILSSATAVNKSRGDIIERLGTLDRESNQGPLDARCERYLCAIAYVTPSPRSSPNFYSCQTVGSCFMTSFT